jgi:hypothetical protein
MINPLTAVTLCFLCSGASAEACQKSTKPTTQVLPSGRKWSLYFLVFNVPFGHKRCMSIKGKNDKPWQVHGSPYRSSLTKIKPVLANLRHLLSSLWRIELNL